MPLDCLGLVCLAAALGVAGCGAKSASVNASGEGGAAATMPVHVQLVEAKPIVETTEYLALLKSRHSATINPQVEGYITKIFVKSGDHVAAGEALLQIDPLKQEATVNSQEATRLAQESNVNLARVNLERSKKLAEAGVIAKSDLDNAQTNYDTAVAQLKSLEHQVETQRVELRYYKVSAPMNGVVGDIPVRVGDRVIVSTLLTTVDEPGALEAYLYIPAARGKDLRLGLPVKLLDEAGNVRTTSQVTFISPQVDPDTQTVLAKAAVPNSNANLRIAQQVRAQVVWGSAAGPVVPVLAVTRINGQFFVFVAEKEAKGTVARQRMVKVGDIIGNDYAVLDGLKQGEHLIVSGTQFLQDGAPVSEQMQSPGPKADNTPKTGK
ncbi:MAG TPA: efflux RND transporter periplasmic adaptor subunit [Candidatus Sulfotelmatobacter sp.]|jgi:RND family efflux transporter MFP subunit|nr:efflux RND transporter periplasmic adaptor subunit [Candidatus Sulfotelmatobacter sp.]